MSSGTALHTYLIVGIPAWHGLWFANVGRRLYAKVAKCMGVPSLLT